MKWPPIFSGSLYFCSCAPRFSSCDLSFHAQIVTKTCGGVEEEEEEDIYHDVSLEQKDATGN